jgi:hypothetical protein
VVVYIDDILVYNNFMEKHRGVHGW